ncbi:MAG TPA: SMC-Scp complex subunit ScpB [Thermoanaerobaculia bacterium]|nr:SMC-Scp complex subunit ScpB [Thermoanaerobaculia bacterium]
MSEITEEPRPVAMPTAAAGQGGGDAGEPGAPAAEPEAPPRPRETRAAKIRDAVEALLFSSPRPVGERDLANVLEATPQAVREALESLAAEADVPGRGVRLEQVGGGWRYVTRPEFDSLLRKYHDVTERSRLSLAALETLAIIAYRQPITLPEVQEIRGVNSSSVLKTLFEKKLITTAGKKAVVGTPFLYRTTPDFLVRFGLNELEELPKPEEIEEDLAATLPDESASALPPRGPREQMEAAPPDEEEEEEEDDDEESKEATEGAEPDFEDDDEFEEEDEFDEDDEDLLEDDDEDDDDDDEEVVKKKKK